MRARVTVTGVLAGVACLAALYIEYYQFGPAEFVTGWPYFIQASLLPVWMPQAVTIFCAVTLFAFGWVAARWSWARTWQASVLAGLGIGILAGCITYTIMGVFWYGLSGQAEVLQNFYLPLTEVEGTKIVVGAIFKTGTLVYINFIVIIPACGLSGALGGLTSALVDVKDTWGRRPNRSNGWLFRLSAYLLVICGVLNITVTIAVIQLLWEKALNSGVELQKEYDVTFNLGPEYGYFHLIAYLAGILFTFIPAALTWGWILRTWKQRGRPHPVSLTWLVLTVTGAGSYTYKLASGASLGMGIDIFAVLSLPPLVVVFATLTGTFIGFMAEPLTDEYEPPSFADRLGYLVSYGILGGAQIVMGSPAIAIPLALITIVNIPHLVSAELVERSPASQVVQLFNMQIYVFWVTFAISVIIGLVMAGLVSIVRRAFGFQDSAVRPDHPATSSEKFRTHRL